MKTLGLVLAGVLVGIFIFAFMKHPEKQLHQLPYVLNFGLQGIKDFTQYNQSEVDNHPVASFRTLRFSPPNLGQIKIENGTNSLVIDHVFHVLGTSFHKEEGIEGIDIDAGLNKEEFVRPEQAYQAYVSLMKQVDQARWKLYILEGEPRTAKEDNMRYFTQ